MALYLKDDGYNLLNIKTNHFSNKFLSEENALSEFVTLDEDTFERLDLIVVASYGDISYMPLFLDYNMITDVSEMKIGDILIIPPQNVLLTINEEDTLLENDEINSSFNIPGFLANDNLTKKDVSAQLKGDITVANKKLKIIQSSPLYSSETGKLTF